MKFLQDSDYDFVMAVGDDKTDEDMFRALEGKAFTIKIGPGNTMAKYNLADHREVINFLADLVRED